MSLPDGARIGLLEARLSSELAELVRREGGVPVCAPAVREAPVDVAPLLPALADDLRSGALRLAVFLTGAGATSLLDQARDAGEYDGLVEALRSATIVCRALAVHHGGAARGAPRYFGGRSGRGTAARWGR